MRALILNGSVALREMGRRVESTLSRELSQRGYTVTRHNLACLPIPDCKGDFGCWTVTPGVCVHAGPHRLIARDLARSDLAVWLTPVTFGGYSSVLKRQLDHCIPLISPRFTTVDGESHHRPRYERFPSLLAVGLVERAEPGESHVFERLVQRNAINMYAPHAASSVLETEALADLPDRVAGWVDALPHLPPPRVHAERLDLAPRDDLPAVPAHRVLLLMGSPRGAASVSSSLVVHLASLLRERGLKVVCERIHARTMADPELARLASELRYADVVALASPLYVDSLPGPVTEAFELLARHRTMAHTRPRFLAVLNCGFPESVHNDTGLAICRQFAARASMEWIGGLGIGGGGMLAGAPLAELGARGRPVARALAMTADAIAHGAVVPEDARELVAQLPIPTWLYRFIADRGMRHEAKKHGVLKRLSARPYAGAQ